MKSSQNSRTIQQKHSLIEPKSTPKPLQKNQNLQNFFGSSQTKRSINFGDSSCKAKAPQKLLIKEFSSGSPEIKKPKQSQSESIKLVQQSLPEVNITVYHKYENTSQHSQPQHFRKSSISSNSTFLGGRSTNSVFSYRSTSAKKRFTSDKTISVQKIDMRKIIQKKPDLYFDSAFTSTLDQLLEQSYQLVQTKKQLLYDFEIVEVSLSEQIEQLIQEVAPLQSQAASNEEALFHQNEILTKYTTETKDYQDQIHASQEQRKLTEAAIENETTKFYQEIADLEQTAEQIQTDINVAKVQHDLTRSKLENNVTNLSQTLCVLNEMLVQTKNVAFDKQVELNEKARKMENKSKMFLGMLGHY